MPVRFCPSWLCVTAPSCAHALHDEFMTCPSLSFAKFLLQYVGKNEQVLVKRLTEKVVINGGWEQKLMPRSRH